jgi:GGDEF domain-containing protein
MTTVVDWEPVQNTYVQAVAATGRSLALRANSKDEQRLQDLQELLPAPMRDRLTGTWNANGMDRLIEEWVSEPEPHAYPSCYAMCSISHAEDVVERHGAACIEHAVRSVSELLARSLGGSVAISRYQPHRFLLHYFGRTLPECRESLTAIAQTVSSADFFTYHDASVSLALETTFWSCNRSVEPEELVQLLEDGTDEGVPGLEESRVVEPMPAEVVPEPEKPFSIDDLAPFPCPWDDPPEPPAVAQAATVEPGPVETSETDSAASEPKEVVESTSSQKVEGFASPEQIEELLSQLNGGSAPDSTEDPSRSAVESETRDEETHASLPASATSEAAPASSERPPASAVASPPLPSEANRNRSIYTDDIEESLLKDDLASLFAAVRSSAVGDFGYSGDGSESKSSDRKTGPEQG